MNETEKIARDICEFSGIFLTCEECCKTTGRICECIRYAARIWNKGYRKEGRGKWEYKRVFLGTDKIINVFRCSNCGVRIGLQTKTAYARTAARRWTERKKNESEPPYAFIAFHRHRRA